MRRFSAIALAIDGRGFVWYTAFWGNRIGRLDPESGAVTEYPLPAPIRTAKPAGIVGSGPWQIAIAPDGDVVFNESFDATIGRLDIERADDQQPVRRPSVLTGGRKRVLVALFVPSVERDGTTPIDQARWVDAALEMFGRVFGGATAYPQAKGVWRDDERNGARVKDEPVVAHCYTTPADIEDSRSLAELGEIL